MVEISDDVAQAMRLPAVEIQCEAKKELAMAFYSRGILSLGKAVEMSGITRCEFETLLADRHIERPYDIAEIDRDLAWANEKR